jgi:hypothetical protein
MVFRDQKGVMRHDPCHHYFLDGVAVADGGGGDGDDPHPLLLLTASGTSMNSNL